MKKINFRKICIFQGEQAIFMKKTRFSGTGFNENNHMLISQEQKVVEGWLTPHFVHKI